MPDAGPLADRAAQRRRLQRTAAKGAAPTAVPAAAVRSRFRNPLRPFDEQRSLFGEILDWMLAPLLLLWPMSVTLTYVVAQTIANAPFDRNIADAVTVLANHVRASEGSVTLQLPMSARDILRADPTDHVYYMVLGLRGEFVAGDAELPIPSEDDKPTPRDVQFRFERLRGEEIRVAYTWAEFTRNGKTEYALVQIAETLDKRSQLANEIIRGVIIPQFLVLPVAVLLVWFGLSRGLAPLAALRERIRARRPDDESPIDPRAAPEEIAPLVDSFNELLTRLSQNLQAQQRFLADAAHQMKTPLAGLLTQAELALRETDPQELRRSLRHIARSTERATHLVNQLLALARAEHTASDPANFQVIDLIPLARRVVGDMVHEAITRSLDLGFEGDEGPARIVAAPLLVRELLRNLIENSLRYTPAPGTVTVRVRQDAESVFLEVEDTGPGIPEFERQRVFDRFYRILGTNVDGSGLGLAIVREIAEQHDALIRVSANPRAGTTDAPGTLIRVEFPAIVTDRPHVDLGNPHPH
jgi:two-component system sensor histidine kinase TctE